MSEETVSLIARLFSRNPKDLDAAIRLARGQDVSEDELRTLQRAGFLRRRANGKPGLLPSLLAPLLALEETIAQGTRKLLMVLQRRLRRSSSVAERESVLEAMFDELSAQRKKLRESGTTGSEEDLLPVLNELRATLESLDAEAADPGLVMGTATLAAELIEMIGRGLAPRRQRKKAPESAPTLTSITTAQLASLVDSPPRITRPMKIPDAIELAAAVLGEQLPERTDVPAASSMPVAVDRREEALQAIAAADPLTSLYKDVDVVSALERHAALAVLGRRELSAASLIPGIGSRRFDGIVVSELAAEEEAEDAPQEFRVVA